MAPQRVFPPSGARASARTCSDRVAPRQAGSAVHVSRARTSASGAPGRVPAARRQVFGGTVRMDVRAGAVQVAKLAAANGIDAGWLARARWPADSEQTGVPQRGTPSHRNAARRRLSSVPDSVVHVPASCGARASLWPWSAASPGPFSARLHPRAHRQRLASAVPRLHGRAMG